MRLLLFIIISTSALYSCSSILLPHTTRINVHSLADSVKICINNDTLHWEDVPTQITAERTKNDLLITAKKETTQRNLMIKSELSGVYLFPNFLTYGIGYLIDLTTPKRFTYLSEITIDLSNPTGYHTRKKINWDKTVPEKDLLSIKVSIPESNQFYLNKGKGYGNAFGFLGISVGLEYYYSDRYCLNADIGTLTDFMIPFPAPIDHMGPYNQSFARYADLQIGRDLRKSHFDFGVQYTRTAYYERETVELFPVYIDTLRYFKTQKNIGFALSSYYRILPNLNIGLNYYPSILNWDTKKVETHYSHLLFFEIMFRFDGYRPSKKKF
jgi:hypothetical protein